MKTIQIRVLVSLILVALLFSCNEPESYTWQGCGFTDTPKPGDFAASRHDLTHVVDTSIFTIPVIFHVVYKNMHQNVELKYLLNELSDLNRDFLLKNSDTSEVYHKYKNRIANPRINFILADTFLYNNKEKGVVRRKAGFFSWNLNSTSPVIRSDKYLNVYVGNISNDGYVPSARAWKDPSTDGIYLNYRWVGRNYRLLTHETGHWLGLYHIFEGGCTVENDGISDTPPQDRQWGMEKGCDTSKVYNRCENSEFPMLNNYMDYSDCRKMFTADQVVEMRQNLLTFRKGTIRKN